MESEAEGHPRPNPAVAGEELQRIAAVLETRRLPRRELMGAAATSAPAAVIGKAWLNVGECMAAEEMPIPAG
jgi:hypothetical protein